MKLELLTTAQTRDADARTIAAGTPDIFVHMETLRRYGIAELKPGDRVLVRFGDGSKGLMAAEVRMADTNLPSSH